MKTCCRPDKCACDKTTGLVKIYKIKLFKQLIMIIIDVNIHLKYEVPRFGSVAGKLFNSD